LVASSGETFKVFSTGDWRELVRGEHQNTISGVAFSSDGRYVITVSESHVRVTRTDSWQSIDLPWSSGTPFVAISADGNWLAIRHDPYCQRANLAAGTMRIFQLSDGQEVASVPLGEDALPQRERGLCKTPVEPGDKGKQQESGRAELAQEGKKWPALSTGERPAGLESPEGRFILKGSNNSVELNVPNDSHPIASMKAARFAFTSGGRWLITASGDPTVRVWALRSSDLVSETCARVTQNLSASEWRRLRGDLPYAPICTGLPVPKE
jgi:WD40 repeat protein